jgi:hypothetical protein
MKDFWITALNQDRSFNKIKRAIEEEKKQFSLKLKLQIIIAECLLNEKERL